MVLKLKIGENMNKKFHAICEKTDEFGNPECPNCFVEFDFDAGLTDTLLCWLEHEKAEEGAIGYYGEPLEPSYPDMMTLVAVWVRGVDVIKLLSQEKIEEIENLAHQQLVDPDPWSF